MVLGDAVSRLQTFVWILNHVSRSITSFLFTPKASTLVKWQLWMPSFMWWCHFIDWLKFETRPSSLRNSRMANYSLARPTVATPHKFCTSFWQVSDKFDGCWFPKSQSHRPKIGKGQEGRRCDASCDPSNLSKTCMKLMREGHSSKYL